MRQICRSPLVIMMLLAATTVCAGAPRKAAIDDSEFSSAVVEKLVDEIRQGLESHNSRRMLSAFDHDKMEGYGAFAEQIQTWFEQYESFRMYFNIAQTTTEGAVGIALVDVQLEEIPRSSLSAPVRKSGQLRLEFQRGRKGWKIVDFRPRNFFL